MATVNWPIAKVEEALGAVFKTTKPGVHSLIVTNKELGVRLRLEIAPEHFAARVYLDRDRSANPTFIARVDWFAITSVEPDVESGRVRIKAECGELLVTATGTFRVVEGIEPAKVADIPQEVEEPVDEITLVGKIGRPRYLEPRGIPLWTAGIGDLKDGALEPVWYSVEAWRGIATHSKHLERGQMVKAVGKIKEETYEVRGETKVKQIVVLSSIEPV